MTIGTRVIHIMGHVGTIVAFDGSVRVCVRFINTTSWVWISDVVVIDEVVR